MTSFIPQIPAMILAAGRGERMRPLTDHIPKPLLRVGQKTLIEWQIQRLQQAGIQRLVINYAWLGEQIRLTLGDGRQFGMRIDYSAEATALESAGGIRQALALLDAPYFLVTNGDVYCDYDYTLLARRWPQLQASGQQCWLVLVPNPTHHPEGDFGLAGTQLTHTSTAPRYTFSGIGLYHQDLFADLPVGTPAKLAPLIRRAIERQQAGGELYTGHWVDVGTPERLAALDQQLNLIDNH